MAPKEDHHRVVADAFRQPANSRRPVGRPRTTWLRTIDDDLQSSNFRALTAIIQKERLMLLGHLVHQSDWSRPVGCPFTSWMATLKSDLSLHNLTFVDAIGPALDKSRWRLLVASGATH